MTENKTENENEVKAPEMVRVRVKEGRSYVEDEFARTKVHTGGAVLSIPPDRVNHTVEVLDKPKPTIRGADPDGDPEHRMIKSPDMGESPRNKGRKGRQ